MSSPSDRLINGIVCGFLSVLVVVLYLFSFLSQNPGYAIAASILLGAGMIAFAVVVARR